MIKVLANPVVDGDRATIQVEEQSARTAKKGGSQGLRPSAKDRIQAREDRREVDAAPAGVASHGMDTDTPLDPALYFVTKL